MMRKREEEDEAKKAKDKRGSNSLAPPPESHVPEDGRPRVSPNVGTKILIEAFSRATVKTANPKGLSNAKVVFQLLLVFHGDTGKDFRSPFHGFLALLLVLCQARVGPFAALNGFFVFQCTRVNRSPCLSDVNGFFAAAALESVDAFASAGRRAAFVFSAEDALQFAAAFAEEIAASLVESAFELMGDARDKSDCGVRS